MEDKTKQVIDWLKQVLPDEEIDTIHVSVRPERDIESRFEHEDQTAHNE